NCVPPACPTPQAACNDGDNTQTSNNGCGCTCDLTTMEVDANNNCVPKQPVCPTPQAACNDGDNTNTSNNGCGCTCDPQTMVEENGICVPRQPVCQAGELLSSGCVCDPATMVSHEGRCKVPVCQEDQSTTECALCDQPLQDQDGVCRRVSTTCNPPSGCSSAPTTGWPALLGFGALLPLLAARRRRRK
ncbi:MAG: hypothetical protein J6T92_07350, partial [Ottowia sp.]|nr:hypothetical protein [Ottowia sp.]